MLTAGYTDRGERRLVRSLRPVIALLAAAVVLSASPRPAAQAANPAAKRAAFLKLIDRKRVPLDPQTRVRPDGSHYQAEHFSFAAEAGERVTGILMAPVSATGARPAVIVLHGTGAKKEEQLALLRTLADRGLTAVAIDARYHGERERTGRGLDAYFDALLEAYRTGRGHPYMYDGVWDTMRLVDYLETRADIDAKRIGLMGLSKGGIETYLTAAVDPRIVAAIPVIGVQGFGWALEHDAWQARAETLQTAIKGAAGDEGGATIDEALVRKFYARVSPGIDGDYDAPAMLPLIAPRALLVINGDSDPRTPLPGVFEAMKAAEAAYAAAGVKEKLGLYLQPHSGHVFTPVAELVALDWFVRWLAP